MKKITALVIAIVCLAALSGCGKIALSGSEKTPRAEREEITQTESEGVPQEPFALTVTCGEESVKAWRGTYSWMYTGGGVESDSLSVLECKKSMEPLVLGDELTARLQFEVSPDSVSVLYWGEECWGSFEYYDEGEAVPVGGSDGEYTIELKSGSYIYQVYARWDSLENCGGSAYYGFYTE